MNKELTPLEALERLIENYYKMYQDTGYDDEYQRTNLPIDYEIIETALKNYELMKQTKFIVVDKKISDEDIEKLKNQKIFAGNLEQCEVKPLFDEETQNKLKALEIIKEKPQTLFLVKTCENYDIYLELAQDTALIEDIYSSKEYDLLKEVLL